MAHSAIKIRLYPNQAQAAALRQNCGCCRFVYNHFLARCIDGYNTTGQVLSSYDMIGELPALKLQYPWLSDSNAQSLQGPIFDLSEAYKNFFRRVRNGQKPGFPKFKRKFISRKSFRISQSMLLNPNTRTLKLPKIGEINFRCNVENFPGVWQIKSVTVFIDAGKFYASCLIDFDHSYNLNIAAKTSNKENNFNPKFDTCGIDLGVKRPLTIVYENSQGIISTSIFGRKFSEDLRKKEQRRKHYQRTLSRRQKGSNNHEKARRRVARSYQKERFSRQNWIEQTSHALSSKFEVIKFEDLKISNMTRSSKGTVQNPGKNVAAKSGLNREMLRLGLSTLVARTEQKSMTNGGQVIYINPRYTSQTCSDCGVIDKKSRRSQSKFSCVHCGHTLNADTNAALNILRA